MVIMTAKVSKRKILAAICAVAAAVLIAVFLFGGKKEGLSGRTEADRTAYIADLGYNAALISERSVTLPEEFDEAYEKYNGIQKECGFDLEPFAGKKVTLYTYNVLNYPDCEKVLLDLLVFKGNIIGGSVYTSAVDGFMHGLKKAQ